MQIVNNRIIKKPCLPSALPGWLVKTISSVPIKNIITGAALLEEVDDLASSTVTGP